MYKLIIRPLLFLFYAERSHKMAMFGLKIISYTPFWWLIVGLLKPRPSNPKAMAISFAGLQFEHPLGLAAGFDKSGTDFSRLARLGFSHIEVGTITALAQPGNPKPRIFRIPQARALINRMGFNNPGAEASARFLPKVLGGRRYARLGINIGKSKLTELDEAPDDYGTSARLLGGFADYIAVNVSSPNTPGLRTLQTRASLVPIIEAILTGLAEGQTGAPVVVKIAPDLEWAEVKDLAAFALEHPGIHGLAVHNTTIRRPDLAIGSTPTYSENGGLSGAPLHEMSVDLLGKIFQHTKGDLPLIGIGGIVDGPTAWRSITHGASLIQVYTGYIYEGPGLIKSIVHYLDRQLRIHGMTSIAQAVGSAVGK